MPQGKRICKICGKEYPYCKTFNESNTFRYQDVACCKEHGEEYLALILKSREPIVDDNTVSENVSVPFDDYIEYDFDDEDEDMEDEDTDEEDEEDMFEE